MTIDAACQLWIEQRIEESIQDRREISAEIERVFNAKVKPMTITKRASRMQSVTNVTPETKKPRQKKDKWPTCSTPYCRGEVRKTKNKTPHSDGLCSTCHKDRINQEKLNRKQAELDAIPIDPDSQIFWQETLDMLIERFRGCPTGKIPKPLYDSLAAEFDHVRYTVLGKLRKHHDARYL